MIQEIRSNKTLFYSITYILSIIGLSALMGYLIAECPCNTDMGIGFLFAVFCYTWIVISIVFHYHKIVRMHVGYSILSTFLVSIVAVTTIVWLEFTGLRQMGINYRKTILQNYFMQWFVVGTSFGAFHGVAMLVMVMIKDWKKIWK